MGKKKDAAAKSGKRKFPKSIAGIKIPKAVRQSGAAALDLAQSPEGRKILSAGLAAAAAAVTANSRVRGAAVQGATDAGKATADAANAAGDGAARIGTALMGIAGLAAERFFGGLGSEATKTAAAPEPAATDAGTARPEPKTDGSRRPAASAKAESEFPLPPNGRA